MSVICVYPQQLRTADRLSAPKDHHIELCSRSANPGRLRKGFPVDRRTRRGVADVFISNRVGPERSPPVQRMRTRTPRGFASKEDLAAIQDAVKRASCSDICLVF